MGDLKNTKPSSESDGSSRKRDNTRLTNWRRPNCPALGILRSCTWVIFQDSISRLTSFTDKGYLCNKVYWRFEEVLVFLAYPRTYMEEG